MRRPGSGRAWTEADKGGDAARAALAMLRIKRSLAGRAMSRAPQERKANRRGAARLAAVQALYQMDIAGTDLNEILKEYREPLARRRGRGLEISAGRSGVLPRHRRRHGARAAQARSADRCGARRDLAAQAGRGAAARGVAGRGVRARPAPATFRRGSWCPNMSMSPMPSSTATRPAWSMPCSTHWRVNCGRRNSAPLRDSAMQSAEDKLIARFFKPLATHAGALGLTDDRGLHHAARRPRTRRDRRRDRRGQAFSVPDPPDTVGRKALRVNLSDLAAKGAEPVGFLMSIGLPQDAKTGSKNSRVD